jgi:hypothetical protein
MVNRSDLRVVRLSLVGQVAGVENRFLYTTSRLQVGHFGMFFLGGRIEAGGVFYLIVVGVTKGVWGVFDTEGVEG